MTWDAILVGPLILPDSHLIIFRIKRVAPQLRQLSLTLKREQLKFGMTINELQKEL